MVSGVFLWISEVKGREHTEDGDMPRKIAGDMGYPCLVSVFRVFCLIKTLLLQPCDNFQSVLKGPFALYVFLIESKKLLLTAKGRSCSARSQRMRYTFTPSLKNWFNKLGWLVSYKWTKYLKTGSVVSYMCHKKLSRYANI